MDDDDADLSLCHPGLKFVAFHVEMFIWRMMVKNILTVLISFKMLVAVLI